MPGRRLCVRPTRIGSLPPQSAALHRARLGTTGLVVRAATEDEPLRIRHAAMTDPATAAALPVKRIRQLCDDMVRAHGDRSQPFPRAALDTWAGAGHLGRRPPAHGKPEAADGHERSVEEDGRAGCRSFPLRYVPPGEPDLMARSAGMRPRHRRDGWSRVPFTAESTGQVPVYRRPAGRRGRTDGRRPCPCGHPALPRRLLTQAARRVTFRA
uniref:hypothetical protein n=1 Tax=Streptomyces daghestanicus TaxID=66885 RepID=UPI0027E283DA|nr:hypothetical protein [Streptomyces daghestanicus]